MLALLHVATLLTLVAAPAPKAEQLKASATAAYRAKRYEAACRQFAEAAKLAPEDAPLAADLGLCLQKLGRTDEAVAATLKAIRLAGPDAPGDDPKLRRAAYFNLRLMEVSLPVPGAGKCGPLPAPPGCDRKLQACTYRFSSYGSGGGDSGEVLSVARAVEAARLQETGDEVGYDALAEAGEALDPPPATPSRGERALLHLSDVEEMFVARCYEFAGRGCLEDEETQAKAGKCVAAKGCKADPWTCPDWDACVEQSCPAAIKAEVARREADCSRQADALADVQCRLVAADACLGLVATVCEDVRAKRPTRVVHESLIEQPQGDAEAPVSR